MGLSKTAEKLNDYYERVKAGKATKIKPDDVQTAITSLQSRERDLLIEIDTTEKPSKQDRLRQKLATTRDLIVRAEWLLAQIS